MDTTGKDIIFKTLSESRARNVDAYLNVNFKLNERHTSIEKIPEFDEGTENLGAKIPQLAQLNATREGSLLGIFLESESNQWQ